MPNVPSPDHRGAPATWNATVDRDAVVGVRLVVELTAGGKPAVSVARRVSCGEVVLVRDVLWAKEYPKRAEAKEAYDVLSAIGANLTFLAAKAAVFGPATIDAEVDQLTNSAREKRSEAAAVRAREARERRKEAAWRDSIDVYFTEGKGRDKKQRYADLRRQRDYPKPICRFVFGSEVDRARFWDWLQWQADRHQDFARIAEEEGAEELRRRLYAEMLETEVAVKKRGHGAGGSRPLRFWRGDL